MGDRRSEEEYGSNGFFVVPLPFMGSLKPLVSSIKFGNQPNEQKKSRTRSPFSRSKQRRRKMMKMKNVVVVLVLCVIFSGMENAVVDSAAVDCYDACSTGCVQRDTRLMARCDRKCQIRCGPDSQVEQNVN
ncbi:hypothetical protein FF1_020105 [Malus domestica]|nr:uncharacterized protein LOC103402334 isoform X1 [Malus domestica]